MCVCTYIFARYGQSGLELRAFQVAGLEGCYFMKRGVTEAKVAGSRLASSTSSSRLIHSVPVIFF